MNGTIIGDHYRIERQLGRGGMATVYLCTDTRLDEQVAVKVLLPELGDAVTMERFHREITFASELKHPRIPEVLTSGSIGKVPFYVMRFVKGEPLRNRIRREERLPVNDALDIALQVIETMVYAHESGILHRDIKPENILLSEDGVHVLDFGIARAIEEAGGERLTATGLTVGTPTYMSPEQVLGSRDLDERSDVYSLACVLYEMLAGVPPFDGPNRQAIMARRFAAPPTPIRRLRPDVPEGVDSALQKALEREAKKRFATAGEFGAALKRSYKSSAA
ncbi:MAG TPA: serine/threonine-protein kinase [Gemmatimonadaceae bacterium]|nr:serine/threonine-protein kinase [Gemmatimonadaceae bacterium]